jgi:hypothetical protein
MARRFMDSCGYYAKADITKKWTGIRDMGGALDVVAAPTGRGAGNAIGNIAQAYNNGPWITLDDRSEWTVGFALWSGNHPSASDAIIALKNDTNTSLCGVSLNRNGTLSVWHMAGEPSVLTELGSMAFALSQEVWYYIEAKFVIHATEGSITVRVDGTERISVTGDTTGTYYAGYYEGGYIAMDSANTIQLYAPGQYAFGGGTMASYIRDIWINDDQTTDWQGLATTHTGFDGDRRIRVLLPETPSGAHSDWTGSDEDSTDNFAFVDENPTSTTDYVTSSTVGHIDTYNFQQVPDEAGGVGPLQLVLIAQKDYTDPRKIQGVARIDAVDYNADAEFGVSGSSHTLGTSWNGYRQIWEVQPVAGNAAWDKATVDAAEFGQELTT